MKMPRTMAAAAACLVLLAGGVSAASTASASTVSQREAISAARSYLSFEGFSRTGLIAQLSSKYGSGFSRADAVYAVDHISVNWNVEAARSARSYMAVEAFSRSGMIAQLDSSYGSAYTATQASYGADAVGLVAAYKTCVALNRVYPHGVGRKGARDHVSGHSKPVTNFAVSTTVYKANAFHDGDRDGVACER